MAKWRPIETAPKDGTWILVHGFKQAKSKCISHWYAVVQWEPRILSDPTLDGLWLYGHDERQHVKDPKYWTYLPDIPD